MKKSPKRRLQLKADAAMQKYYKTIYKKCIVCSKPMVCMHHYVTKGRSNSLRYDEKNLIPICAGCHLKHHTGDPAIHNKINDIKGKAWRDDLEKRRSDYVKTNMEYYRLIIEKYAEINEQTKGCI
jgi:hypothetical protein